MKNNKFTVNGKEYKAKEIDLAEIMMFEDYGLNLGTLQSKPINAVVAYLGICADMDKEEATEEIRAHMIAGGDIKDIYVALDEQLGNSGFFLAIKENAEKEAAKSKNA